MNEHNFVSTFFFIELSHESNIKLYNVSIFITKEASFWIFSFAWEITYFAGIT